MNVSKDEAKDIVVALKLAKLQLWDGIGENHGHVSYICVALDLVTHAWCRDRRRAVELIKYIIGERMGPRITMTSWLKYTVGIPANELTLERVQAHRHAWVDLLIEEFSNIQ